MRCTFILVGLLAAPVCFGQGTSPEQIGEAYQTLINGPLWVHPAMKGKIQEDKVLQAVLDAKPLSTKFLVVPSLGSKWRSNGKEMRGKYAKYLFEKKLYMKDGLVVVATKNGITGYSNKIPESQLITINDFSSKLATEGDYTPAFLGILNSVKTAAAASKPTQNAGPATKSNRPDEPNPPLNPALLACPLVAVAGGVLVFLNGKKAKFNSAQLKAQGYRDRAVTAIAYLDSFSDLIADGSQLDKLKRSRDEANRSYEVGLKMMEFAKTPDDFDGAVLKFESAVQATTAGNEAINQVTGGTNEAFSIAPLGYDSIDDPRIYQPVPNVCFFCSKPGAGDLTPVTINIKGQRQTVLVCPTDLATVKSGKAPELIGQKKNDKFTPWYGVSSYDPNTHYGSGSHLWDFLALSSILNSNSNHTHHSSGGWWSDNSGSTQSSSDGSDFTTSSGGGDWSFGSGSDSSFDSGGGSYDSGGSSDSGGGGGGDF